MNINESLILLKEQVSKETYLSIVELVEGSLFRADKRGDLLDDISKALTGKSISDHLRHGTQKLVKNVENKIKNKANRLKD